MIVRRIAIALFVSLLGCAERTTHADQTVAHSAAASANAPTVAEPAVPTTNADPCAIRPSADKVRVLQKFPFLKLADLRTHPPADGLINTEGTVTSVYHCPPCPPKALCKPCAEPFVTMIDEGSPPIYVDVPSGIEIAQGQRFRVSLATCASTSPRYQLRGMESVAAK